MLDKEELTVIVVADPLPTVRSDAHLGSFLVLLTRCPSHFPGCHPSFKRCVVQRRLVGHTTASKKGAAATETPEATTPQ